MVCNRECRSLEKHASVVNITFRMRREHECVPIERQLTLNGVFSVSRTPKRTSSSGLLRALSGRIVCLALSSERGTLSQWKLLLLVCAVVVHGGLSWFFVIMAAGLQGWTKANDNGRQREA